MPRAAASLLEPASGFFPRVLQRGRDATRDSPGAIIPIPAVYVNLVTCTWDSRDHGIRQSFGGATWARALFSFFRIRPWQSAVGVREREQSQEEEEEKRSCASKTARAGGVRGHAKFKHAHDLERLRKCGLDSVLVTEWGSAALL